nr:hypothetical protein [Bacteroidota bacterium]
MSPSVIRIIVAIVFLLHGTGHAMGILAALGVKFSENHSLDSWLLTNSLGTEPSKIVGVLLCVFALLGFVGAGLSLPGWIAFSVSWKTLAAFGAIVSLALLVMFWNAFPFFFPNKIGVILVDVFTLLSVYYLHWPGAIFEG